MGHRHHSPPLRPPRGRSSPWPWRPAARGKLSPARSGAQRAAGDDRHASRGSPRLLRLQGGRHAEPRRAGRRGALCSVAVAHAPLTAPSHASILTGHTPLGHGVRDNGAYVLPEGARSVAEDFRQAGYRTAGFVSGFPLKRRFGFDRGFDTYDDQLPRGKDARRTAYVERTADRTTEAALRWLETATPPGSPAEALLPVGALLRPARALRGPGRGDGGRRLALRRGGRVR